MKEDYKLVLWPWVQELMSFPWFAKECYIMHGLGSQEHFTNAYFVPKRRLEEIDTEAVFHFIEECS